MALTMTRTRTQTTLTKLALMVASIHGELAFVEGLIAAHVSTTTATATGACAGTGTDQALHSRLERRRQVLAGNRDALYTTIRQFDPEIAPECIGTSDEWKLSFGNRTLGLATLTRIFHGI